MNRRVFSGSRTNRDKRDASRERVPLRIGDSVKRPGSNIIFRIEQIVDHIPVDAPRRQACIAILSRGLETDEPWPDKPEWEFIWNLRRALL